MRVRLILAAAAASLGLGAQSANAQVSGELEVSSSYLDTRATNYRISDEPQLRVTGLAMLNDVAYVELYANTGFNDLMNDDGSEYGAEIGIDMPLTDHTSVNIAAGRWANYQGAGFSAGDWFGAVRVTHRACMVELMGLVGDSDTGVVAGQCDIPVNDRLTITPRGAFLTNGSVFNPSVGASHRLSERTSVRFEVVYPETDEGRRLFAAVTFRILFGE